MRVFSRGEICLRDGRTCLIADDSLLNCFQQTNREATIVGDLMDTLYLLINGPSVANPEHFHKLSTNGGTTERGRSPHKGTSSSQGEIEG